MSAEIDAVRQAIVTTIAQALGSHVTVEAHGGRFDRAELARYSKRAPAVLVAAMGMPRVEDRPRARPMVQFAAFVMCRDAPGASRDTQALTLAEALVRLVPGNVWGQDNVQRPEQLSAENLYSGEIDRLGIAMWAVSWRQIVNLSTQRDIGDLADFAIYHGTHHVGEGPDTESHLELPTGNEETSP
ncbi:hypothetical protein [Halomonas sp.]|uniref:phage protein Gp37 n=1 Tax=Halomonas sp. TaxID=1486246 RepID=UPI00257D41F7|nr:hypothetical protein [Halomonas sp.]MCJ8285105.1 DUF1834 family protein [Halomonas sp.]NQY70155.1 hypothetical protein [Halomonas sp.]